MLHAGLILLFLFSATGDAGRRIPAFPEAEGAGAFTQGGRAGQVHVVTTLSDYVPGREKVIPGSLRSAIENKALRTIVFAVAGNINLKEDLVIRHPYVTIAGQSAPGQGICLMGSSLVIDAPEVIVRYLRIRPGDIQRRELDAISCSAHQVIIDHCSASWAIDETISTNGDSASVTVQWCMISESLNHSVHHKGSHGYGSLISGPGEISYHHNVYAYHRSRNPRPGDVLLDFRNNLIVGWGDRAGYSGDEMLKMNYVGNYLRPLPYSKRSEFAFSPGGLSPRIYMEGNELVGDKERTANNALLLRCPDGIEPARAAQSIRAIRPFVTSHVATQAARDAYHSILKDVGVTKPARDPVDERVLEQIRSGTVKLVNSQADVGDWPVLATGKPIPDVDSDGMPDDWEIRFQLDPAKNSDSTEDADNDGYTNIEEFLNNTNPRQAEKWIFPPVVASSNGDYFVSDTMVRMSCETPGTDIRYTLDASIPTRSSNLYSDPFRIGESTMIRAVAFTPDQESYVVNAPLQHLAYRNASKAFATLPGLIYELGDLASAKARLGDPFTVKTQGVAPTITSAVTKREAMFALRFTGYFSAPTDGVYTFYLRCSPRGRLYFGDDLIVQNEGRKCEHAGKVALLRGFHAIKFLINYPEDDNKTLEVSFEGPEIPRQLLGAGALFHSMPR